MRARLSWAAAALLLAAPALADFYVASDLNGWANPDPAWKMTDVYGDGSKFQLAVSDPLYAGRHEWKVTDGTWSNAWPGNNARADFGAGALNFNFYPGQHLDGWKPEFNRVGYDDPQLHGWEVMGSFNGWSAPVATLAPVGGGVYEGLYAVPTAGTYYFKFRKTDDWDISIGSDFSNFGYDIELVTPYDAAPILFELDLPNGRWRTTVIPEPAALALAALALALRRR